MRKNMVAAMVCLMLLATGIHPAMAGQNDAAQRAFGFGAREIYEFKKNTSRLFFYDIDLDGQDDILFLNNRMSRIEVLIRKAPTGDDAWKGLPALEDAFVSAGFLLDQKTTHL